MFLQERQRERESKEGRKEGKRDGGRRNLCALCFVFSINFIST
jgi:hypothetical protein